VLLAGPKSSRLLMTISLQRLDDGVGLCLVIGGLTPIPIEPQQVKWPVVAQKLAQLRLHSTQKRPVTLVRKSGSPVHGREVPTIRISGVAPALASSAQISRRKASGHVVVAGLGMPKQEAIACLAVSTTYFMPAAWPG